MIEIFRLLGAPSKVEFLRNGMNVIDVLAVVPYYVELTMAQVDTSGGVRAAGGHNTTAMDTLEVNQLFVNITPGSGSVHDLCIRLNQNKEVNHVPGSWWTSQERRRWRRTRCRGCCRCSGSSNWPGS